jgi:hypothetical protein
MKHTAAAARLAIALLVLTQCATPAFQIGAVTDAVDTNPRAWRPIPPPTGSGVSIDVEQDQNPQLVLRYRPEPKKLAGIVRTVDGLSGGGLSIRLRTDTPASIVIGVVERDGSMYQTIVQTEAGEWRQVGIGYERLRLSDDSKDEDRQLGLDEVASLVIADPQGFLGGDSSERTLRIDSVAVVDRGDARLRPLDHRFTFDTDREGWGPLSPPVGSDVKVSVEREGPASALVARYRPMANRLAGLVRAVDGVEGRGLRMRLKSDSSAVIVLGAVEADGSMYQTVVRTAAEEWQDVAVRFDQLQLSDSSKDENRTLDLRDITTLVVADPAGFLNDTARSRTLWIDEFVVERDTIAARGSTYVPLVTLGPATPAGTRASTGVDYRTGRFGRGVLIDTQGENVVVPVALDGRGTIEAWISPQFDVNNGQDFSALFAMHDEPFAERLKSSLIVFYAEGGRISVLVNGDLSAALRTPILGWRAGQWHHLAVSWGERGVRLYADGRLVAARPGGPNPGAQQSLVVGNHAWTTVTHRVSRTIFDELRVSSVQRRDDEISASARRGSAHVRDAATVALEPFDGTPWPPVRLAADPAVFHQVKAGMPVTVRVAIPPGPSAGTLLRYTVATADGVSVQRSQQVMTDPGPAETELRIPGAYADGFYRITFALTLDGRDIDAGADWFRVRSDAAGAAPSSLFGASGHLVPEDPDRFFRAAAAAGVRSYRTAFEWSLIEPRDNTFVWDRYDRLVAAADRHGIELVPTLFWESPQPAWAGPRTFQSGWNTSKYPPRDLDKWRDFVFQVVNRYKGSITWWIPSNEPNLAQFWYPRPSPREYVAFLEATRAAARRADPEARFLGGSVAGLDLAFLREIFKAGALDLIDAVGVHAYIAPHDPDASFPLNNFDMSSERGTFLGGLSAVHRLILEHGGRQRIWMDEAGQPYRDDFIIPGWNVDEPRAAAHLVKIHVQAVASRVVDRVLWFSLWGGEYGSFALARPDLTPTMPLVAYATLADWLAGAEFVGETGGNENLRSYSFRGPRGAFDIVWSPRGGATVPLREADRVFDVYGHPVDRVQSGPLAVDGMPRFIRRSTAR